METHVRVLGLLYVALATLVVLFASLIFVSLGSAAGIVGASADPRNAAIAIPVIGVVGTALVSLMLLLALPVVLVGVGLLYFKPWARVGGLVVGALALILFPWGTILGVYALWVLFSKETERLFDHSATLTRA